VELLSVVSIIIPYSVNSGAVVLSNNEVKTGRLRIDHVTLCHTEK